MIGVIHPLVFFPIYESTKFYLKNNFEEPGAEKLSTQNLLFSSIVSKVIACSISYPHEVLRSRMMYEKITADGVKQTLASMIQRIVRTEGVKAFYAGFGLNLAKVVPNAAITFFLYENICN